MSGQISSFLSGSNIVIRIGDTNVAYCSDLTLTRNVQHVPVYGIGSYSPHATEPVGYSASGSMRLARYTTAILTPDTASLNKLNRVAAGNEKYVPDNLKGAILDPKRDGNSLLDGIAFNPVRLLISSTFDIEVFEREHDINSVSFGKAGRGLFILRNCRLTGYSFNFAPGELLYENISFLSTEIEDKQV
jgi:hypothetical protein